MPSAKTTSMMRMIRRMALGVFLAPVLAVWTQTPPAQASKAGMPRTERHEVRHEIDQLEEKWRNAILKSDVAVVDSLLAEDYNAITPSGTLQTKQEALDILRSGRVHFTTFDISDRKVRFYGKTALVTSVATILGTNPEGAMSGSFRYTRVYVRDAKGTWKVVSFEANRIREPGDHGSDHSK
ncbi:MAG: nuclear transport factor 2 family protein [Terracidiphilus sp.]